MYVLATSNGSILWFDGQGFQGDRDRAFRIPYKRLKSTVYHCSFLLSDGYRMEISENAWTK